MVAVRHYLQDVDDTRPQQIFHFFFFIFPWVLESGNDGNNS